MRRSQAMAASAVPPRGNATCKVMRMKRKTTQPSRAGRAEPRLPAERDEAPEQQSPQAPVDPQTEHAREDAQRGSVDTDRAPVVDRLYNDTVRPPAPRKRLR